MGGCATKPKDLDTEQAPASVESPTPANAPVVTEKTESTLPQEDGSETKKEEPLVEVSEPALDIPKTEEVKTIEESVPASVAETKTEAVEEVKQAPKDVAAPAPVVPEVDAPKSEKKSDALLKRK